MLERGNSLQEMNEMPNKRKSILDAIFFLLLLGILFLRCTHGLDLTDEMQYYGQIASLAVNSRLFESDLFLQQLVYLLFYPFFKVHYILFGEVGLVIFGRLLLAFCLILLFVYSSRRLRAMGGGTVESGAAALALTFAPSYHGIFAISYNTISQIGWVLFLLWFVDWTSGRWWRWATLITLTGFAHPPAAIAMGVLLSIRLVVERRFSDLLFWFASAALAAAMALGLIFCFTNFQDLSQSLLFSKGFAVGSSLFSGFQLWRVVFLLLLPLVFLNLTPLKWVVQMHWTLGWCVIAFLAIIILIIDQSMSGFTRNISTMMAILVLIALSRWRSGVSLVDSSALIRLRWLTVGISAHFLTLVFTSSNGLGQGVGAMLVALPLLIGLTPAMSISGKLESFLRPSSYIVAGLLVSLLVVHWCVTPYRESRWYLPSKQVSGISAIDHIWTAPDHVAWFQAFKEKFAKSLSGQKVLIVSDKPALYFALSVVPQSCMLFMHSLGDEISKEALRNCLDRRFPASILYVEADGSDLESRRSLKNFVIDYAQHRGMNCQEDMVISLAVEDANKRTASYMLCHVLQASRQNQAVTEDTSSFSNHLTNAI